MELLNIDNHVQLRQIKDKSKEAQIKGIQEHMVNCQNCFLPRANMTNPNHYRNPLLLWEY